MKNSKFSQLLLVAIATVPGLLPATASACAVCMGNPNTKTAGAMNGAIFLMLGFIALMLGGLGAFIYTLVKRGNAPVPPHAEISAAISADEKSKVL